MALQIGNHYTLAFLYDTQLPSNDVQLTSAQLFEA